MNKFAIVFAGQGSQSVGMMAGFTDVPVVWETFDEASDSLGTDFRKLVLEGPAELLNQTVITQPLMLTAGVATYRAWCAAGGATPNYFAGHSLGEYTALVAAGALSFGDALPLVRFRAEAMQRAVPEGAGGIAAILGLDVEEVEGVCRDAAHSQVLEAVNLNSPGQVVIAGDRAAVERGMQLAKERGAKRALLLPMSVPSHCRLMHPAADELRSYLDTVSLGVTDVPVVQNAAVETFASPSEIKAALVKQLYRPVRWIETIHWLANQGTRSVIECVPGKILTGLNKRIEGTLTCAAISDSASLQAAVDAISAGTSNNDMRAS